MKAWPSIGRIRWGWFLAAAAVLLLWPVFFPDTHTPTVLLIWALFAGALLRGGAELLGGYEGGWSIAMSVGGTLTAVAFTIFAVGLWRATASAPSTF